MIFAKQSLRITWAALLRFWRLWAAIAGGLISAQSLPRENLWGLIFPSVALLLISVRGRRFWPALGLGFVGGMSFYLSQIEWLSLYLGWLPWVALSVMEAFFFAFGMVAIALVWNWLETNLRGRAKTLLISLAIATLWTSREWLSTHFPYGGFPWSRLAQTQADSLLANWVFYGGLSLLSFMVTFVSALLLCTLIEYAGKGMPKRLLGESTLWITAAAIAFVTALPLLTFPSAKPEVGTYVLGAVQGNANAGLFANPVPGSILAKHLIASRALLKHPLFKDLQGVVWPENASDLSPLTNPIAKALITDLVDNKLRVPLFFGTLTERDGLMYNTSIHWEPGKGMVDYYDKKRPIPFAEYVPDRSFWYPLAPDLIGLIQRGYSFGTRDGIFHSGSTKLGSLICFEIAIDEVNRDLVNGGAKIILAQSNNADFGHSDETFQQAAIVKLRAIETGRPIVYDSTVGSTAVYLPDGSILGQIEAFKPGVLIERLPLRTTLTPAMIIGGSLDLSLNLCSITLICLLPFRRQKRGKPAQ
jgi:apolipoprotein N-acyltransferase